MRSSFRLGWPVVLTVIPLRNRNERRLLELAEEIAALRGQIRRSFQDEALLVRIFRPSPERDAELFQLQTERERAESALDNLLKERRELSESEAPCRNQ